MTIFEHKYKERDPLETISIVKNFFNNRQLIVHVGDSHETESGTWWCLVFLLCDDTVILTANGKGATETYSLASGYAELYERFCSGLKTKFCNCFIAEDVREKTQELYHYTIEKQERLITLEDMCSSSSRLSRIIQRLDTKDHQLDKVLQSTQGSYIGSPFYSLTEPNEIKYFDVRLLLQLIGSSGLAAGNTVEEALVQGLSEEYEHYCWEQLYTNPQTCYYNINLEVLNLSPYLQKIIYNIKNLGHQLFVFDLSYNFNLPVLLSVLIDSNTNQTYLNFGAAPVFEIALERILTEVYQGYISLGDIKKHLMPMRLTNFQEVLLTYSKNPSRFISFPENILLKKQEITTFNTQIFYAKENYSNQELLNHLIAIGKNNGFEILYNNCSLSSEMAAIHIYIPNIDIFDWLSKAYDKYLTEFDKQQTFKYINQFYQLAQQYYKNGFCDISQLLQIIHEYTTILDKNNLTHNKLQKTFYLELTHSGFFSLISYITPSTYELMMDKAVREINVDYLEDIFHNSICHFLAPHILKFIYIIKYIRSKKYSKNELITLFNYYNISLPLEIIETIIDNYNILIEYLFFQPWLDFKQSNTYKKYILALSLNDIKEI